VKLSATLLSVFALLLPASALAHEHRVFQIGNKDYEITIGSLNEPVNVGDKSGVELTVADLSVPRVIQQPMEDGGGDEDHGGNPVMELEKTLKVEVNAGDQKKTFDLRPQWGTPGGYQAVFYPTMQTTYTYRLMGTINDVPVDLSFSCNPAGHPVTQEDTTPVKLSDQVTQKSKAGAFGCPQARTAVEFPSQGSAASVDMGVIAVVLSIVSILVAAGAWKKARMSA
jgi:hypothetical protein